MILSCNNCKERFDRDELLPNWDWRCPQCGSSDIEGKETILDLIEQLKSQRDTEFRRLCDEAIKESDALLEKKGKSYNCGNVHITDYSQALSNPVEVRFVWVYENALRLRSAIASGLDIKEKTLDLINQARFLYAEAKMRAKQGQI